jgi:hypothetical protein
MNIGDLDTPAVVIDLDIMERNLRPSAAMIRTSSNVFFVPGIQRAGGVKAALRVANFSTGNSRTSRPGLLGNVST